MNAFPRTPYVTRADVDRYLLALPDGEVAWVCPPSQVGDWIILGIAESQEHTEAWDLTAALWEGDLFRLVYATSREGQLLDASAQEAWAPELRPRPDLAEQAREWITYAHDPLRDVALATLAQCPERLLDLMPPLVGPGFVRPSDPSVPPTLVQPDGSTQVLGALPIGPEDSRRYGLLWGDGPVLLIGWNGGSFALIQAVGEEISRLTWAKGCLTLEPRKTPEALLKFLRVARPVEGDQALDTGLDAADRLLPRAVDRSLRLARFTFRGLLPRYGVGIYDEPRHNSFPPATLFLVESLLLWGKVDEASRFLSAYLLRYGREDGALDYYGPSLSEYGQLLDLTARLIQWCHRRDLVEGLGQIIAPLARRCAELVSQSAAAGQVVPGLPEADYHADADAQNRSYASGYLWLLRGLRSLASALAKVDAPGIADCVPEALVGDAELSSLVAPALTPVGKTGFLPALVGDDHVIHRMTESREASYTNYRFWPEMLSSGLMPDKAVKAILQWRREHGGELAGMTRFADWLDDWPVWNHALGLLQVGDGDTFTMLLWAHLLYHQMPGWWPSYEQVDILPDDHGWRQQRNGQVVPCQVTAALMLRAGLLWGDRDGRELSVLPAGKLLLDTLGGKVHVPPVPTGAGPAGLLLRAEDDGVAGTLRVRLCPGRDCPVVILPRGSAASAAYLEPDGPVPAAGDEVCWEEPPVSPKAQSVAFRQEGNRWIVEDVGQPGAWVRFDFRPATDI